MLSTVIIFPLILIVLLRMWNLIVVKDDSIISNTNSRDIVTGLVCFFVAAIPFYSLMGYYVTRLEWSLTVPLIVLIALELQQLNLVVNRLMLNTISVVMCVLYISYWIFVSGPYS